MSDLIIKKGGTINRIWSDESNSNIVQEDVRSIRHLFETCTIEDGVTLRDIFLILQKDIDIYEGLMNRFPKILEEGFSGKPFDPDGLEYLELGFFINVHKYEGKLEIENFSLPDFFGIGPGYNDPALERCQLPHG